MPSARGSSTCPVDGRFVRRGAWRSWLWLTSPTRLQDALERQGRIAPRWILTPAFGRVCCSTCHDGREHESLRLPAPAHRVLTCPLRPVG